MDEITSYFVPEKMHEIQTEVKKSRFIARAEAVSDPSEAREAVLVRKQEHPDAAHVVYAFIIGDPSSETSGMSDDGEPKGTAGRPVMEVLKGSGIRNVLLTVTRYFGGTKLGTGGLVRAYGDAAKIVLKELPVKELQPVREFSLSLPYELYEQIRRILSEGEAEIHHENFGTEVEIRGVIPEKHFPECRDRIRDISAGKIIP